MRCKLEEKTLKYFINDKRSLQNLHEKVKAIKSDGKETISNLSSVRSDAGKDISNDKDEWIY